MEFSAEKTTRRNDKSNKIQNNKSDLMLNYFQIKNYGLK